MTAANPGNRYWYYAELCDAANRFKTAAVEAQDFSLASTMRNFATCFGRRMDRAKWKIRNEGNELPKHPPRLSEEAANQMFLAWLKIVFKGKTP